MNRSVSITSIAATTVTAFTVVGAAYNVGYFSEVSSVPIYVLTIQDYLHSILYVGWYVYLILALAILWLIFIDFNYQDTIEKSEYGRSNVSDKNYLLSCIGIGLLCYGLAEIHASGVLKDIEISVHSFNQPINKYWTFFIDTVSMLQNTIRI